MLKFNHGITLISLIITIVIMLILAGVSVSFIIGNNGLFKKANSGAKLYKEKADDEQSNLDSIANSLDEIDEDLNKEIKPTETPFLTSDSDKVFCSGNQSGYEAWKAFDNKMYRGDAWFALGSEGYVGYDFTDSIRVTKIQLINNIYYATNDSYRTNKIQVLGSNDKINYTHLTDELDVADNLDVQSFNVSTDLSFRYIIVKCKCLTSRATSLRELKICSYTEGNLISFHPNDVLTGPSSCISASSEQSGYEAWKMFDGKNDKNNAWFANRSETSYFIYNFNKPIYLNSIQYSNGYWNETTKDYRTKSIQLYGSNDNTNWTPLTDEFNAVQSSDLQAKDINSNTKYQYIKVLCTANPDSNLCISLLEFKFDYSE